MSKINELTGYSDDDIAYCRKHVNWVIEQMNHFRPTLTSPKSGRKLTELQMRLIYAVDAIEHQLLQDNR